MEGVLQQVNTHYCTVLMHKRQTYNLIGGDDYVLTSTDVVIPAGQTSMTFSVTIMNDNTVETNENFILEISSNSLPNKISVTTPERTIIDIVDNDG